MAQRIRWDMIKGIKVPIEIFELRFLSPFECVTYYLTAMGYKQNEISFLMKRDPRTIQTFIARAQFKITRMKEKEPKALKYWERKVGIENRVLETQLTKLNEEMQDIHGVQTI